MKLIFGFLLLGLLTQIISSKSIVKRDCCCDNYNDCDCSVPCNNNNNYRPNNNCNNRPCNSGRNCQQNNSPCNNNVEVQGNEATVPVLVPFPQPSQNQQIPQNIPSATTVNNTNINNSTLDLTLTNTINSINNISVPISVNSTNENIITVYLTKSKDEPMHENEIEFDKIRQDCCIITSPKCGPNGDCVIQTRRECSDICTGQNLAAINEEHPVLAPPVKPPPSVVPNNTQIGQRPLIYYLYPYLQPQPYPLPPITQPPPIQIPCSQPQSSPISQPQPQPFPIPQPPLYSGCQQGPIPQPPHTCPPSQIYPLPPQQIRPPQLIIPPQQINPIYWLRFVQPSLPNQPQVQPPILLNCPTPNGQVILPPEAVQGPGIQPCGQTSSQSQALQQWLVRYQQLTANNGQTQVNQPLNLAPNIGMQTAQYPTSGASQSSGQVQNVPQYGYYQTLPQSGFVQYTPQSGVVQNFPQYIQQPFQAQPYSHQIVQASSLPQQQQQQQQQQGQFGQSINSIYPYYLNNQAFKREVGNLENDINVNYLINAKETPAEV